MLGTDYGFHEDGVKSALNIAKKLKVDLNWLEKMKSLINFCNGKIIHQRLGKQNISLQIYIFFY